MSDQRVSREEVKDDAARALHARVVERWSVALADLFLPETLRLSEWQRTVMAALLGKLIVSIEGELRAQLARRFTNDKFPELHAALTAAHVPIAFPILEPTEALRDQALIALLLRRAEEHRVYRTRPVPPVDEDALLAELVRDRDPQVSEAAMALLIGQSRRLDGFQEPMIAATDLPAEVEHSLVWTVAAALRSYMVDRHAVPPAAADRALADAAARRLADYDEGDGLEARCEFLVRRLSELGRLDGDFAGRAITAGGLPLLIATLAIRCELSFAAVWEVLSDRTGVGAALLVRSAQLERAEAAAVLATLADGSPAADLLLVRQLDLFDTTSVQQARDTLALWRIDTAYRTAIGRLAQPAVGGRR